MSRASRRGLDLSKLESVIELLAHGKALGSNHRDHPLKGEWKGFREAHVSADWLLIYRIQKDELQLARTGSHADLF